MSYNESLSPNSNYPPMSQSEWDNAPFNEPIIPERDFDIDVEFVMSKTVTVTTNDYAPEYDEEDGHTYANTDDTNWENAYDQSGHCTIPELLDELKGFIEKEIPRVAANSGRGRELQRMLESCQDWECYDKSFNEV